MRNVVIVLAGAALLLAPLARGEDVQTLRNIGQGRALYLAHCTQCHGNDAKGGVKGPDLTVIVARDGSFNTLHVVNHITGRYTSGAPKSVMPRWITYFQYEHPRGEAFATVKAMQLTRYLEWVQRTGATTVPEE